MWLQIQQGAESLSSLLAILVHGTESVGGLTRVLLYYCALYNFSSQFFWQSRADQVSTLNMSI